MLHHQLEKYYGPYASSCTPGLTWKEIAELGWLSIAVPEEFGGSNLSLAEVATVAEPMGRHLAGTAVLMHRKIFHPAGGMRNPRS